ncbi:MAG TPA: type II secretion system protein [Candidatus Eremiobacteraceae bacterium]|nr:type II secretion system protein [Candidatus Eremiobacteraceae bacterium]
MLRRRAFTLVELMIVIAIISTLAAILIPSFLHARSESVSAACEANERQIATALEEYAVDNGGQYPPAGTINAATFGGAGNSYLGAAPTDPADGLNYMLIEPGDGVCQSSEAFKIKDNNGHDSTTLIGLTGYATGISGVRYCQSSGLHASTD